MKLRIPETAIIPPSDYVIFGGTGDLATRKILPALYWRFLDGQVNEDFNIYICSRNETKIGELESRIAKKESGIKNKNKLAWKKFTGLIKFIKLDLSNGMGSENLSQELVKNISESRPIIYYFALSSELFSNCCEILQSRNLNVPQSRVIIEKPLGQDQKTAKKINDKISVYFSESQVYRIDHYLGKETVQNLMALRFANVIFENQWNNRHIENIQITVSETVGLEDRANYTLK